MSTRSPTTIKRLGVSSGMGISISLLAPRASPPARCPKGDTDHLPRLTAPGAVLLMRPAAESARRSTQATIAERPSQEVSSMLLSLQQALPQTWRETFQVLATGFTWVRGLSKTVLALSLFLRLIKFIFTRPLALLDWATRQYFQPGVPWIAFVFILFWSALEATIFTFTLRPTITEVLADLTGSELSGLGVSLILWPFLFILISGDRKSTRLNSSH